MVSPTPLTVGVDAIDFQKQVNSNPEAWVNQASTPVTMAVNTGYTSAGGATTIAFLLPVSSPVGAWVEINGQGTGLFVIDQNAGQRIHSGSASTTPGIGGQIASQLQYTAIKLRCVVADLEWEVVSYNGAYTIL